MRKYLIIILFLQAFSMHSQERVQIKGFVKNDSTPLENVHVKNISSGKFSVSNSSGEFLLSLQQGDTLVLSHVGMNDLIQFIKEEDLQQQVLIFRMTESSSELREVVVDETSEINAVSLGIIPKKIKKLSVNERRLKTAGDFKPKHLLGIIGGGVSLDAILNAINGRTKKLKRNVEVEKKQRNIAFLEIHYMEYLKEEIQLSHQEAQMLIGFVIEDDELNNVIDSGIEARMHLYLHEMWFRLEQQKNSSSN